MACVVKYGCGGFSRHHERSKQREFGGHRTSNATRGAMAATIDHSDIRGLGTAFHLFFAGLPRSRVGDHRVDARIKLPRIPLIEPAHRVAGSVSGLVEVVVG